MTVELIEISPSEVNTETGEVVPRPTEPVKVAPPDDVTCQSPRTLNGTAEPLDETHSIKSKAVLAALTLHGCTILPV